MQLKMLGQGKKKSNGLNIGDMFLVYGHYYLILGSDGIRVFTARFDDTGTIVGAQNKWVEFFHRKKPVGRAVIQNNEIQIEWFQKPFKKLRAK